MIREINGWEEDEDIWDCEPADDEYDCQCSLCHCLNKVRDVSVCGDCGSGAHQG